MIINRIEITNWRSIEQQEFKFNPGITFIIGENGTGKTSILEAIAYVLTGKHSIVKDGGKLLQNPDTVSHHSFILYY
jgi:exonuclease SbcC